MGNTLENKLKSIAGIDLFKEVEREVKDKSNFVGFPFELEYEKVSIVVNDYDKEKVQGIPKGCFLICVNTMQDKIDEVILLRVLQPVNLPAHSEVLASRVEYYKEFIPKDTRDFEKKLDSFTKNEFQYSGLECRVLGTFYKDIVDGSEIIKFGADVENFYSSHNYTVFKPNGDLLKFIVNYNGESNIIGGKGYSKLGTLRYSSVRKPDWDMKIPVYINPVDLLKNRTACFGMTRTGKSNTVKKIIECTVELAKEENRKIGQIIFDINGEYANPNKQDEGTAIYKKYQENVVRYSLIDKDETFIPMRANFYNEPEFAMQMIRPYLQDEGSDYVKSFNSIDLSFPTDANDPDYNSIKTRISRTRAAFICCLNKAEFKVAKDFRITFPTNKELVEELNTILDKPIDPRTSITINEATKWFETLWINSSKLQFLKDYYKKKDKQYLDDDIKTILRMLTLINENGKPDKISGYKKLRRKELKDLHTPLAKSHFEKEIVMQLREGKIVIVDLSEGPEVARNSYSERIVSTIFTDSMNRFIANEDEQSGFNIIQLYFEEAHNLFPKKENSDLSDIYNRLAKEGAKYNLGINYATQEVSSISSNILKNTQNWFVAHLNNKDEIKELVKFYDFEDFAENILKIKDKGFIKMKTYSNDFIVPVQINKFTAK